MNRNQETKALDYEAYECICMHKHWSQACIRLDSREIVPYTYILFGYYKLEITLRITLTVY